MKIAWIGLGSMGRRMCSRIAPNHSVRVWNRTAVRCNDVQSVHACAVPEDAVASAEVCFVCLYDEEAVEEVLLGPSGVLSHLPRRSILVLHSTVSAGCVRKLQVSCNQLDIGFVCAPVSGSLPEAEAGRLTVIAGAVDIHFVLAVRPLLENFGAVIQMPSAVAAIQAKLLINAKLAVEYSVMRELTLAAQDSEIGADGAIDLFERIACFSGRGLRDARFGLQGCPGEVRVPVRLLLKDLGLKSRSFKTHLGPVVAASMQIFQQACTNGFGKVDAASLIAWHEESGAAND